MEQERVRTQERGPQEQGDPEAGYKARNGFIQRQLTGRLHIRGRDVPVPPPGHARQADSSWYLSPERFPDTALQSWYIFINNIRMHSGKHIHQGGICLFILNGVGQTLVEGQLEDWKPGDLVLLPIKPGGVEHQHFDSEAPKGARWLAFLYLPQFEHVASGIQQVSNSYGWAQKTGVSVVTEDDTPYHPNRDFTAFAKDSFGDSVKSTNGFNGYAELIKMRDDERTRVATLDKVIHGDRLDWETNPQGIMQWYMHPRLPERLLRSYLFYRQEIPGESRSGKQLHQGGMIFFITEGRGHTVIDGERFDWEKDDLIQLPLRPDGAVFQHFNDSRGPARLIACEPNYIEALGVDRGSGFVQIENCPEYERL